MKKARLPKPETLLPVLRRFAPGWGFWAKPPEDKKQAKEIIEFGFDGGAVFVMVAPLAVPDGEADRVFKYSLSSWSNKYTQPKHKAHLVVTMSLEGDMQLIEAQRLFTRAVAGVVEASEAVGVYWGMGNVSHPAKFFLDVVGDREDMWITLWTGISRARDNPLRMSLLSLGMAQFGLMDLLVTGPFDMGQDLLMSMFQALQYSLNRGQDIPEGDTIGGSSDDRLVVKYEQSPIDPEATIWRIDY